MNMTKEEQAVVKAAKRLHALWESPDGLSPQGRALYESVDSLLASEKVPPSPAPPVTVEECVKLIRDFAEWWNGPVGKHSIAELQDRAHNIISRIAPPLEPCGWCGEPMVIVEDWIRCHGTKGSSDGHYCVGFGAQPGESRADFHRRINTANRAIRAEREAADES